MRELLLIKDAALLPTPPSYLPRRKRRPLTPAASVCEQKAAALSRIALRCAVPVDAHDGNSPTPSASLVRRLYFRPRPAPVGQRRRRRIGGPLPEYPPSTAARNTRTDAHVTRANLPFPAPTQFRDHRRGTITDPTAYAYTVQPPGPTPSPLFLHLETSAELIGSAASGPRLLREQGERRGSLSAPSPSSV